MAEKKEKRYVSDDAQLMAEWYWKRNTDTTPTTLTLGNNKKVWRKCCIWHEWEATENNGSKGHGCPYCAGQKAIDSINDLLTVNPVTELEIDVHFLYS